MITKSFLWVSGVMIIDLGSESGDPGLNPGVDHAYRCWLTLMSSYASYGLTITPTN